MEDCKPWTYWLSNREKAGTAWTQSGFCSHSDSVLRALSCHPRWREGALAWPRMQNTHTQNIHTQITKQNKKNNVHSVKKKKDNGTGQNKYNTHYKKILLVNPAKTWRYQVSCTAKGRAGCFSLHLFI